MITIMIMTITVAQACPRRVRAAGLQVAQLAEAVQRLAERVADLAEALRDVPGGQCQPIQRLGVWISEGLARADS